MSQYTELVYWLALIYQSGLKLSLVKPIIQRWCVVEQRPLADIFNLSPLDWATTFGLPENQVNQAMLARDRLDKQAAALERWQAAGIHTITRLDPRYPQRLAHHLPPAQQPLVLWAQGAVQLLNEPGVAMLGNRPPDDATTAFVEELMAALVAEGIYLVSGYGRGLDRAAFEAMLATPGGQAIGVLPMGLAAFAKTTGKLAPAVTSGQIALLSPFPPDTPFQEKFADARNLLIDHLALAHLILYPDEDALARAAAALERDIPVLIKGTGAPTDIHAALLNRGALVLTDAGEVVEMVQQAIIDSTLQDSDVEEPPAPAHWPPDANDDFSLRAENVEPIDSQEALDILSLGGEIPNILRQRLQKPKTND